MDAEIITKTLLTVIGFSTGMFSLLILRKLEDGELSMTKIKLNPGKMVLDFKLISAANAVMLLGFTMYIAGILMSNDALWIASKAIGAVFGLVYAVVLFRWWRRFSR
ncbi:MAG: hypothetical protein ABEK04_02255 [Candidatus Nanohalobium sp.]